MGDSAVTGRRKPRLGEAALLQVVEKAPAGIFVADLDGRYVYVNEAGCRMLGYSFEELTELRIQDLLAPEDVDRLEASKAAMVQGPPQTGEWMLRRKDGSWLPAEVQANILPDGQWQGFVRDISDHKARAAERDTLLARIEIEKRRLETVIETLPLGVVIFEADGSVHANQRTEELLGTKLVPQAGSAQYADRVFYPDGTRVPRDKLVAARVLRGERFVAEEHLVRRPDGVEFPVLGSAAPILDARGRPVGGVGVFQDMSERMRLERSIRESERLLKGVFDVLPVGVWIADATGRIVSNNPAGERIWCGARYVPVAEFGEYKGWWVETGKPIAAEEWALARALTRGETCTGELVRIQCFDGTFKTIINSAAPLRGEHGENVGAIVVNEDITALHDAQEKLRASEELLRTVFDLLPVGLWIANREGRITRINPAGQRIWQGTRPVGPRQHEQYKAWWVESGKQIETDEWALARAIRGGEISRRELIRIQCFDGSFRTVLNWASPIRSATGEITGAIAVNEDVSALHHTQEQLRAAVRDREEILAVVTHDLRSPLNAMAVTAATVAAKARKLPDAGGIPALADNLSEIARQMSGLVNDLLAVSLVRSDRSVLKIRPTEASMLLDKAASAATPMFARAGIHLEVHRVGELPMIQVDPDRILRVFSNLLDNALKFTEKGGEVVLRAESSSSGVRYCVANTGPPLAAGEMQAMFRPFWQAAHGDVRGAGLGLSICRSIVEAHGGTIWAEPASGKRVRVCMLLPRANPAVLTGPV